MSIVPQYFEIREVGKTIKRQLLEQPSSTKKQYVWRFKLEGKDYTVELFTSMLSGKKKIVRNGEVLYYDSKHKSAFQFPFAIGKNALNVVQHGDKYEIRINNQSFTHLWENEKTKKNFNYGNQDKKPAEQGVFQQPFSTSEQQRRSDPRKQQPAARVVDEEQEFQRQLQQAIEESKKPSRPTDLIVPQAKKKAKPEKEDIISGFDHGFGTQNQKNKKSVQFQEPEPFNDFNFDFGNQSPPKEQTSALDDILGFSSSEPPKVPEQKPLPESTSLDFFGNLDFGVSQPLVSNDSNDLFGFDSLHISKPFPPLSDCLGCWSPEWGLEQEPLPQIKEHQARFVPNYSGMFQSSQPVHHPFQQTPFDYGQMQQFNTQQQFNQPEVNSEQQFNQPQMNTYQQYNQQQFTPQQFSTQQQQFGQQNYSSQFQQQPTQEEQQTYQQFQTSQHQTTPFDLF